MVLLIVVLGSDQSPSCTLSAAAGADYSTGVSVAGLTERQLQLSRNGVVIGKQRRQPESVIISELAAQATESTFRNLANPAVPESLGYANDGLGYDHDSVGPHQMRASVWGTVGIGALMTPTYQINWFYDQASGVAGRDRMSPAELAQAVEKSAPNAYAAQLDLARKLYAMFADIDTTSGPPGLPAPGCGSQGSGAPLVGQGGSFGAAVVRAAQQWIGTDYVWGGGDQHGPTNGGFDCSGLTLYAIYQASGGTVRLPHYTQDQQDYPGAEVVPYAQRQPGDLVFFTRPGDSDSHHVGIYLGRSDDGEDRILHAPQTGQQVTTSPLSAWRGERIDIRRYHPPAHTTRPHSPERTHSDTERDENL
ncbi:C40 family peptidase [Nocardia sp. CDC159]|uniref:C40 family peptidase n=1 Tax=Nocardia pulmonis TaxID=2951408 RepID=A0A9X2E5Y7_9NOCA|nr:MULTISPECIES: C40 family peptidase [Nocardia]MCM6774424.1 C40 family peptidase [Nocardia pulmonis]MCM6787510.1 C40 family peptidase [Nocardia sp. CDC159]